MLRGVILVYPDCLQIGYPVDILWGVYVEKGECPLDVKTEMHDVAILHNVFLALGSHLAVLFGLNL